MPRRRRNRASGGGLHTQGAAGRTARLHSTFGRWSNFRQSFRQVSVQPKPAANALIQSPLTCASSQLRASQALECVLTQTSRRSELSPRPLAARNERPPRPAARGGREGPARVRQAQCRTIYGPREGVGHRPPPPPLLRAALALALPALVP